MNRRLYYPVDRETAEEILQSAGLSPTTLTRNNDNTFIATFDSKPAPLAASEVEDAHPHIILLEHDLRHKDVAQINQDPDIAPMIHFAFKSEPHEQ